MLILISIMQLASIATGSSFKAVDALLESFVVNHSFPGVVALVANKSGILYASGVGSHTYEASAPPMSVEATHFDVASLTKVTVTTTCAMLLYQWGDLKLDTLVQYYLGPSFAEGDARKSRMTVEHLLLHEAGWSPDPVPSYCEPSFACPETLRHKPVERELVFTCEPHAFAAVLTQRLDREPGSEYVYSDLSMITMMYIIGQIAHKRGYVELTDILPTCAAATHGSPAVDACFYEAFARQRIFSKVAQRAMLGTAAGETAAAQSAARYAAPDTYMGFLLPRRLWPSAAPTWNDTTDGFPGECGQPYRERLLQGEVTNCRALDQRLS